MPKTKISEFDVNPDNNTDINSINIAEGCAPSGINNAIRQLMSDLKEFQTGAGGDAFTVGGALVASGTFSANGGATLGDASGDALTINSSAVSIPNGLNFDSNTLVIDATNNRVGVGTASAVSTLDVTVSSDTAYSATASGTAFRVANINAAAATNFSSIQLLTDGNGRGIVNLNALNNASASSADFSIQTRHNGTLGERLKITSDGNVVVGGTTALATAGNRGNITINGSSSSILALGVGGTYRSYLFSDGTNLTLNNNPAGYIAFENNAGEKMRITSTGNVGIGTSSPAQALSITRGVGTPAFISVAGNGNTPASAEVLFGQDTSSNAYVFNRANAPVLFGTSNTERMRIDPSGTVSVGTTSASTGGVTCAQVLDSRTRNAGFGLGIIGNASNFQVARFAFDSTAVGAINVDASTTSYVTSSDYRLKENIAPMTGALDLVQQLKPVTYNWKVDGSSGQGFIAHELAEVVPDCVTGEKDAVDAEGKPQYQGIDTSFLVATLTSAIQEQQAIITDLKIRIETLESK